MLNVKYEWAEDDRLHDMLAIDNYKLLIWNSDEYAPLVQELFDDTECVVHSEVLVSGYEARRVAYLSQRTEEKDRERLLSSLDAMNDQSRVASNEVHICSSYNK